MGVRLVTVMTFVWPAIGLLAVLLAFWLISGPGKYKRMFSDEHILEVWKKLRQAKAAAIAGLGDPGADQSIEAAVTRGQRFETVADMTFLYTIDRQPSGYAHHISMSHQRGVLARAAATYFTALLGEILSIDVRLASLMEGNRTIYHLVFELDEASQQTFAARPVVPPEASKLPQVKERIRAVRSELREAMTGYRPGRPTKPPDPHARPTR